MDEFENEGEETTFGSIKFAIGNSNSGYVKKSSENSKSNVNTIEKSKTLIDDITDIFGSSTKSNSNNTNTNSIFPGLDLTSNLTTNKTPNTNDLLSNLGAVN